LLKLVSLRHLMKPAMIRDVVLQNGPAATQLLERFEELEDGGLPAYFTTWIGSDEQSLINEINSAYESTGVRKFKIKIGKNVKNEKQKVLSLIDKLGENFQLAVDANQTLDFEDAQEWMLFLSDKNLLWLEEPFAPDNVLLFRELAQEKRLKNWTCEIATGENSPNLHVTQALLDAGIDRFQADPCRMLGISDAAFSGFLTKIYGAHYTPHSGGAGLDELSPHLQSFFLSRVDIEMNIDDSLTENIGFCSHFYQNPTKVKHGKISVPNAPGLLGGFTEEVASLLIPFRDGVTWLKP